MWLCAGIGLLVALMFSPPPAVSETLDEALAMSYAGNPTLRAERARLRATDELVSQALSGWWPRVTLTAEVGKQSVETETAFFSADESRTPQLYSLDFEQPIYRGGRTVNETKQAESLVRAGRARLLATEQDVLLETVTAYMDVLRDQVVVRLSVHNEQVLQRQLEAVRDRFEVGELTLTDVSQAEARFSQATAERIAAEGDLIGIRASYKKVVGEMPGDLSWPGLAPGLPDSEAGAFETAHAWHPLVQDARYQERAARAEIRTITGELLPELSFNAGVSRVEDRATKGSLTESGEVTARLSIPLYQSGVVYSRVREARERAGQRRLEIDEAERLVIEEATRAWEALTVANAQIAAFGAQVRASEIALEGVEQEETVGLRTVLDVLDAEQELFEARVNLVRARRDEIVSSYRLKSAIGELTVEALALPVEKYDVEHHYDDVRSKLLGVGAD